MEISYRHCCSVRLINSYLGGGAAVARVRCDRVGQKKNSVYLRMFATENQVQNMRDMGLANFRKQTNVNYTRTSFVELLAIVKLRVETYWFRSMVHLFDLIAQDRTLLMELHAYQGQVCEVYMKNTRWLETFETRFLESERSPRDRFRT